MTCRPSGPRPTCPPSHARTADGDRVPEARRRTIPTVRNDRRRPQRLAHDRHRRAAGTPHLPAGSAADGPYALDIDPERPAGATPRLRVLELPPGGAHTFDTGDSEWIVLPLSGGCTVHDRPGEIFELRGRDSVFSGVSDFAYVPRDARRESPPAPAAASRSPARAATAGCPPATAPPPASRSSCAAPATAPARSTTSARPASSTCDQLIAVEVLTPGGNWSSYPPHKHDEHRPGEESELEEIYYFEIAGPGHAGPRLPARLPVRAGPRHGRPRRGPQRRRRAHPRRLARPVHRRARPRHVLPQRHGRARARARVADLRPPRPRLDPRHLARASPSTPACPSTTRPGRRPTR